MTFEYVTNYTGSTDKERRLSRSRRNPCTSSINKYPSERLFCLTIVLTVDEKWFTARIKPPQLRGLYRVERGVGPGGAQYIGQWLFVWRLGGVVLSRLGVGGEAA